MLSCQFCGAGLSHAFQACPRCRKISPNLEEAKEDLEIALTACGDTESYAGKRILKLIKKLSKLIVEIRPTV